MYYIFLSIVCTLVVAVLLKFFKKFKVDALQAIIFNYPTAVILSYWWFKPQVGIVLQHPNLLVEYAVLSFLLLSIFYCMSRSIQVAGIALTEIAQRLSLIIPLLAAFLLFNESLSPLKILGLSVGIVAIILSMPKWTQVMSGKGYYPLLVFFGIGVIDVLFSRVARGAHIPFMTALTAVFIGAMFLGFLLLIYQSIRGQMNVSYRNIPGGMLLGSFNFLSIFFYLKALKTADNNLSVIFSAQDIGVIALSSLFGVLVFKEPFSKRNQWAIVFAVIAIIILSFA